mmetsp:Transcript_2101/g.13650  ORF Transcript_2101/g.13650 Transcript_2101/m.13650 type:complete len:216 (-) Transcript_2101:371-1018(-)
MTEYPLIPPAQEASPRLGQRISANAFSGKSFFGFPPLDRSSPLCAHRIWSSFHRSACASPSSLVLEPSHSAALAAAYLANRSPFSQQAGLGKPSMIFTSSGRCFRTILPTVSTRTDPGRLTDRMVYTLPPKPNATHACKDLPCGQRSPWVCSAFLCARFAWVPGTNSLGSCFGSAPFLSTCHVSSWLADIVGLVSAVLSIVPGRSQVDTPVMAFQ